MKTIHHISMLAFLSAVLSSQAADLITTFTFPNDTGKEAEDLHIYLSELTLYDDNPEAKSVPFSEHGFNAGERKLGFDVGKVGNGESATVTLEVSRPFVAPLPPHISRAVWTDSGHRILIRHTPPKSQEPFGNGRIQLPTRNRGTCLGSFFPAKEKFISTPLTF